MLTSAMKLDLRKLYPLPICLDVEISNRADYDLARFLMSLPSFYYKAGKCVCRIVFMDHTFAKLEVLRF